jgi:hypothetical protein
MRFLTPAFCLPVFLASITLAADSNHPVVAADPPSAQVTFVVGISPFLNSNAKDAVYRGLVRLMVEDLPLNTKLAVYDAYNLKSITSVSIPNAKVFDSPKTRANQFAVSIGEVRQFLAQDNSKPGGSKTGFEGMIRLPQFYDFLAQNLPLQQGASSLPLLLIGNPLYQDSKEPGFSMVDGYFPSDGHLRVSREQSVFGCNEGEAPSLRPLVYWAYFGDPWMSDLHREKVERFWALYVERRGGCLSSFSADLATALGAFSSATPGASAASKGWVADPKQTRPEMIRATRSVELADWLTSDIPRDANPPPPTRTSGPLKIGIRWKEDIDLDLYAAPRRDAETLFFQHTRSPEGYYFKDHRSSPGREYEFIEFESPVDVRDVQAFVNFYAGSCPGGPHGEVRIEFLNRIYTGRFTIASSEGNQGRSGRKHADCWTQIPVSEILRIDEGAARAAR